MVNLIIVESPSKCKKIESFLGKEFKCVASGGHLSKINKLADIKDNFEISYSLIAEKKKFYTSIKKQIKSARRVYIATDDDREGELIGYCICKLFNLTIQSTDRLIFHEITKDAIIYAVNHPTTLNMNVIHSAKARQIIDMFVGFKVTPMLWNNISNHNVSAGRCQIPALRLIYDNFKEKQDEQIKFHYAIHGYFTDKHILFRLNTIFDDTSKVLEFLNKSKQFSYIISLITSTIITKKPPNPLNTSQLQQTCSHILHISPTSTMKICQSLYEKGLITYMRTTSQQYSKKFMESVNTYLNKTYPNDMFHKQNQNNDEHAHEAIRPTDVNKTCLDKSFSLLEQKVYKLIWKISVQSLMMSATLKKYKVTIPAPDNLEYSMEYEVPVELNWMSIYYKEKNIDQYNRLHLLKGKPIINQKVTSAIQIKHQKQYYTEAKLVHALEMHGIGRPSTFSSIIEKLKERQYVLLSNVPSKEKDIIEFILVDDKIEEKHTTLQYGGENKKLILQNKGRLVLEFLLKSHDTLFNYEYTKLMETRLDKIIENDEKLDTICSECLEEIKRCNNLVQKVELSIDDQHMYVVGKHGPVIKKTVNDTVTFLPVKKNIDLDKLRNNKYVVSDLIDTSTSRKKVNIGKYQDTDLFICEGAYGVYALWGDKKKSLSFIKDLDKLNKEDIVAYLDTSTYYLKLNNHLSIREGKYGKYIYYKTKQMKRPKFYRFNLEKEFDTDKILAWIKKTYNIY